MPDGRDPITVKILSRIGEVPAAEWDACAGIDLPDSNPFVSHAFLDALESSRPQISWRRVAREHRCSPGPLRTTLATFTARRSSITKAP